MMYEAESRHASLNIARVPPFSPVVHYRRLGYSLSSVSGPESSISQTLNITDYHRQVLLTMTRQPYIIMGDDKRATSRNRSIYQGSTLNAHVAHIWSARLSLHVCQNQPG
ncbi:hypothetical protein VTK26DRAFT_1967 [Humicola hyalothermophila]